MEPETIETMDTSPNTSQQPPAPSENPSPFLIPGAILVAGLLIAGAVAYTNSNHSTLGKAAINNPTPPARGDLADDDPILGDPHAPVTLVEFGDFQCPFCGQFFQTAEKEIINQYVKTGKVRIVYRDFPLTALHSMAQKSAEASECAHEQGKFWEYHDLLFIRQSQLSGENLIRWAGELGMEVPKFESCLSSGKYVEEVRKDFNDGQVAGVTGTPASFINGRLVPGAQPFSAFQTVIEEELKKAK